jgi:hypothetical protein
MTDLYAAYAGVRVVSGTLSIPYWGAPSADVVLATADDVPASGVLKVGNLSLACSLVRPSAAFAGQRSLRLVGGAGGWRQSVPPRAYASPGGVPLSMVLGDVAVEVGERVVVASDGMVGAYYMREAGPASRVLRQLAGMQWWVDMGGVTRVGPRTTSTIATRFDAEKYAAGVGLFSVATEDLASWQPGASFSSTLIAPTTVSSVSIRMAADGKHRLDVLAGTDDRLTQGFRELVRSEEPAETYRGVWEYSVAATRTVGVVVQIDGNPTASSVPLPPIVGVPIRPGVAGASFKPAVGSLALVAFVNSDPTRPVVIGFDGETPGGTEIDSTGVMTVGASATVVSLASGVDVLPTPGLEVGRVVRYGDTIMFPSGPGATPTALPVLGSAPLAIGAPVAPITVSKVIA